MNNSPQVVGQLRGPDRGSHTEEEEERKACGLSEGGRKECAGGVFISLNHNGKNGGSLNPKSRAEIMLRA